MITLLSLIAILLMFMCIIGYCSYLQNEESIQDMNRKLNMLSKSLELLEQDLREQEQAHQNALKQIEQINET